MKTYLAKFNPKVNGGVYAISLVENPAMEGLFIALSKQEEVKLAEVDKEQRILMGLVLEPNKAIYRNQGGEEFNIVFNEETIKELSHSFFKAGHQGNSTIEHEPKNKIDGVTFVESWIVENPKVDKSTNFGFNYPKGSWIATMKVDSDDVWNDYVKTGKVQGFSVDALISLEEVNLKTNINMSKEAEESIWSFLKDLPNQIALALKPKEEEVKVTLGSVKLADGSLTLEFEGDVMTVGGSVWIMAEDETKVPAPVGEHALEDGTTLVVAEEGVIGEVKTITEEPKEEMASEDGKVSNDAKIASEIESAIKSILIKYSEQEKKIEALENQIVELGKEPASKGIKQPEINIDLSQMTKQERLQHTLNQFKN